MNVLTVREVAEILKLHPRTVTKMARSGELPATRIGRVWRFDESVVLEWFNARLTGKGRNETAGGVPGNHVWNGTTRVCDLLGEEQIQYTEERKGKREVLESLSALAMRTHSVPNYEALVESLVEREAMCPTALEGGIAFPHPRHPLDHLQRPVLAVLVVRKGVPFGAPDGTPTRMFVMVCSPDDRTHVKILAHLARLFRSPQAMSRLRRCHSSVDVLREIRRLESSLIEKSQSKGEEVKQ